MVQFNFKYQNKKFQLDVEKCRNYFSRARGLMFRKKSKPLLFIFKKQTQQAIHSFFCIPFIAVWFDRNEIIDVKIVKPWKISIKPGKEFNRLLEIPINSDYFNALKVLIQK